MNTRTIRQTVELPGTPAEVYELLMDAGRHSAFTGGPVEMSREIRGPFKIFDGYCEGYNLELDPGHKIVQAWKFREEDWPEDHYSICTFRMEPVGHGTLLHFSQEQVPEQHAEDLYAGWNQYYWDPMREVLEG